MPGTDTACACQGERFAWSASVSAGSAAIFFGSNHAIYGRKRAVSELNGAVHGCNAENDGGWCRVALGVDASSLSPTQAFYSDHVRCSPAAARDTGLPPFMLAQAPFLASFLT